MVQKLQFFASVCAAALVVSCGGEPATPSSTTADPVVEQVAAAPALKVVAREDL